MADKKGDSTFSSVEEAIEVQLRQTGICVIMEDEHGLPVVHAQPSADAHRIWRFITEGGFNG